MSRVAKQYVRMGTIVLAAALLFALLLVLRSKSPSQAAHLEPSPITRISHDILPESGGAYHGAVVRGLPAQPDQPAPLVDMFEIIAGKRLSVIKVYQHFFNGHFYDNWADFIHRRCAIEFLSFDPEMPEGVALNYCEVLSGDHDNTIITFAQEIKSWGKPLMLSFAGEMNGDWARWSGAKNFGASCEYTYTETTNLYASYGCTDTNQIECADGPERYRAMYRHVHNIFATQGVTNVTWVWVVNHESFPSESGSPWNHPDNYYPGDEYVDVISVDGYNWGNDGPGGCPVDAGWKTFDEIFGAVLTSLSNTHPTKPFIIGEFASAEGTESWSKANWITDTYDSIESDWPQIKAVVWFNLSNDCHFQIESSLESMWAYRQAIADPYFIGGCVYYPNPSLTVTKQAAPDPVQAGAQLTYTIQVINTGNVTLTATITDVLPDHVTTIQPLTWTPIITTPGGVWTEQVVVTVDWGYTGTLTNVVEVTTKEGARGVYTETSTSGGYMIYLPIALKNYGGLTIIGQYAYVGNPCTTNPCLPGMIYAVLAGDTYYYPTVDGRWLWENRSWDGYTPEVGDWVRVAGFVSEEGDIFGNSFYEIEAVALEPVQGPLLIGNVQ